jgi:hypothetical protein
MQERMKNMQRKYMKIFYYLSDTIKGIILIAAGTVLLLDTLGLATKILHTIVLIGAVAIIIYGIYLANIHTYVYNLFSKKDNLPPQNNG